MQIPLARLSTVRISTCAQLTPRNPTPFMYSRGCHHSPCWRGLMKEGSMHSAVRRFLAVVLTIFAVALIAAPVSFAGEDDGDTSGDSGSAAGGVATGAGGMSS